MVNKRRKRRPSSTPIIGLVGGIASGKSFVAETLENLGCARIDADQLGHAVLENPMIRYSLKQAFGSTIMAENGQVDRNRLGSLVFGQDPLAADRRRRLEEIVHPAIHSAAIQQIRRLKDGISPPVAIVVDAPLLIEAGWEGMCDWIFYVDTPEATRFQRAAQRGWSEAHWRDREQTQLDLDQKKRAATHFIPGDAEPDALRRQLQGLLDEMQQSSPQSSPHSSPLD
jgi:dephospho-CoA kinase